MALPLMFFGTMLLPTGIAARQPDPARMLVAVMSISFAASICVEEPAAVFTFEIGVAATAVEGVLLLLRDAIAVTF